MKAYDFMYDGRKLSSFGFVICNFGSKGLDTISNGSQITFNTVPTLGGSHHKLTSTEYEECLESHIQICKNTCYSDVSEISSHELREITKWLNRKKFLKFKILDDDHIDLYYEASFNISRIEIDGILYGLELQVITNRPFALKEPQTITVKTRKLYTWEKYTKTDTDKKGEFTGKYVTSYDRKKYPDDGIIIYPEGNIEPSYTPIESSYYYVYIKEENVASINDTSYEEGYIYPFTEITALEDGDLKIYSVLEDRDTIVNNCITDEVITMDYPIIQSSLLSHSIQNDFNWNFFRVANTYENSRNDLITSIPCEIKIRYSPIVKVGL